MNNIEPQYRCNDCGVARSGRRGMVHGNAGNLAAATGWSHRLPRSAACPQGGVVLDQHVQDELARIESEIVGDQS
jgi:hypothetical protein